jgi:hypothetical protein
LALTSKPLLTALSKFAPNTVIAGTFVHGVIAGTADHERPISARAAGGSSLRGRQALLASREKVALGVRSHLDRQ